MTKPFDMEEDALDISVAYCMAGAVGDCKKAILKFGRRCMDEALEQAVQELRESKGMTVDFNKHMDYAIDVIRGIKTPAGEGKK